ncbi:MAG: phage tail protein [Oscillospiraceae bacterium]|nr:phage tail protein [Oscillospiraceae bacterium]
MAFYHGVSTRQTETSISTPVRTSSGVTFAVGTAPVHVVDVGNSRGKNVNEPIYGGNYNEAANTLGYGENWKNYTLCEVMYSQYRLYTTSPVIFVNVLDPAVHRKTTAAASFAVNNRRVKLPFEALKDTVAIENYKAGEDFDSFYDGFNLVVELLDSGAIPASVTEISVSFDEVDPSQVTKADIIGGFNIATKMTSGIELIEMVFPKYGIIPDIIICPAWSHDSEVAAIMGAKAASINDIFEAKALIDVDTSIVTHYTDVPEFKRKNNIFSKTQVLCFPMCRLGDRLFHLSTQMAGVMARTDSATYDCPAESPSNKSLQIDSTVLQDGREIFLDLTQANFLNSNGITTALNFIGGFVLWGNYTACYPANTDVKDYFLNVSRMFGWVSKVAILSSWNRVDKNISRRFIDNIVNSLNIWLNGLTADELILGGRIEFREEDNPVTSLMSGRVKFKIFLTPPSPAQEIMYSKLT